MEYKAGALWQHLALETNSGSEYVLDRDSDGFCNSIYQSYINYYTRFLARGLQDARFMPTLARTLARSLHLAMFVPRVPRWGENFNIGC